MDAFEKCLAEKDLDAYSKQALAKAFFRAGMRAAGEINERLRLETEANLARGKGTWPQADYIRDETWANWQGQEQALRWARAAILAEADKP